MENREMFQGRLKDLSGEEKLLIDFAYDIAKESHRPQSRDGGERYFEHVRAVALILMDECTLKDSDLIISALLHDSIEDAATFANATRAYSKWKEIAFFRISRVFGERVAKIVIALTKPKIDGEEIKTKEESLSMYYKNLEESGAEAVLVKMCDRLHNLRSLSSTTPEKQGRIKKETREVYLPLFERALQFPEYQKEREKLLQEIKLVI